MFGWAFHKVQDAILKSPKSYKPSAELLALVRNRKRWAAVKKFWKASAYRERVMLTASINEKRAKLTTVLEQYAKNYRSNAVNNRAIPPSKQAFELYVRLFVAIFN